MKLNLKKIKKYTSKNKKKIVVRLTILLILLSIIFTGLFYIIPTMNNNSRRDRIVEIFNSLHLDGQKYTMTYENIHGDKQIYDWDSSRSYSSYRTYIRGANVDATVNELKQAVANTDFEFYEEPYPGSTSFMYIYKSPKNEYLRISVDSKARADEFYNKWFMGLSIDNLVASSNDGPSNVTIKVNLDDNNE